MASKHSKQHERIKKIAIYIRVSTHHQVDKESLPFQKQELVNYCRYILDTENYEIFIDAGYSAKNTDRPAYQEMRSRIFKGEFTHLLVWKIDRISRNLKDFTEMWDEFAEHDVQFISKMEQFDTSTAMGQAMLQIILVFAELERKLTAERVFDLMIDRASKGMWNGAPVAIGYDWDRENEKVVINEEEAALVRQIFNLYEKSQTTRTVAAWLVENNKQTKRGGTWGSKGVWDVLRNPAYIGIYRWNYQSGGRGKKKPADEVVIVPDALPAIISEDQFNRVQAMLDENYRGGVSRAKPYIPLSRLIVCGDCGKLYAGRKSGLPRKDGYYYINYRCGTFERNRSCPNKSISELYTGPWLLDYIRAYMQYEKHGGDIKDIFGRDDIEHIEIKGASDLQQSVDDASQTKNRKDEDKQHELKQAKQKTERAISKLDDAYFFSDDVEISKSEYAIKRSEMKSKLEKIDHEINSLSKVIPIPTINMDSISRFLLKYSMYKTSDINKIYPSMEPEALYDFFHSVIKSIVVNNGRVDQITFYSETGQSIHNFYYK